MDASLEAVSDREARLRSDMVRRSAGLEARCIVRAGLEAAFPDLIVEPWPEESQVDPRHPIVQVLWIERIWAERPDAA